MFSPVLLLEVTVVELIASVAEMLQVLLRWSVPPSPLLSPPGSLKW